MTTNFSIDNNGFIQLTNPVQLPDVLDLLVVGGGPAGTAAAFRAKELGRTALVIDYDDLMKRIRDYAKDKLILPHFGGGDRMQFPAGDDLISALHFSPIDKDDMCSQWKGHYCTHNVPAQIGIELTGIEYESDGTIHAKAWNHRNGTEVIFRTRHLVLSIGRGVPRRFDIPGNTDGISYRMDDPSAYTGHPVCVIGGGTSAAEAVIAISNAKRDNADPCPVYWSYRGDKMPKVSKALSEVFFNTYLGNGNIRYYPKSEPVAIVTGPDRQEYLSIRVDRRTIEGRSIETTHLEFLKHQCIACIGEDIPESFLRSLGIHMMNGGPKNKKRMVVSSLLESQQPNIYLIGDILSQAYLETEDFGADPGTFKEIRHPGNIKSALRDGVFVAEVIHQKLDGKSEISVVLDFAPLREPEMIQREAVQQSSSFLREEADAAKPPIRTEEPAAAYAPRLIRITPADLEEDEFLLNADGSTSIGKTACDITLSEESSLADHHATVRFEGDEVLVSDEGGKSGTFLRLHEGNQYELANGDLIQLGRQFLVFVRHEGAYRLMQYNKSGTLKAQHPLSEGTVVVGRDAPIILDKEDTTLSRRHLAITVRDKKLSVKDLNSVNRTYLRIQKDWPIQHGDVIRLGQCLFRLSLTAEMQRSSVSVVLKPPTQPPTPQPVSPSEPAASSAPAAPAGSGPSVTFEGHGAAIPLSGNETVLSVAKQNDIPINYECESGRCGFDPVRIVSGAEHLNEMDEDEEGWTIEEVCHLKPGAHRLACMLKAKGPIVVALVDK